MVQCLKSKYVFYCALILFLIILFFVLKATGILHTMNLSYVKSHHLQIASFIERHYLAAVLCYLFLYIFLVILMAPITTLLNVAAGFFFGTWLGTLWGVTGASLGSLCSFLLIRYFFRKWALKCYAHSLKKFEEKFNQHGPRYILTLDLIPITPYALVNCIAGLSEISVGTFFLFTTVGVTPYIFLYVLAGKQLVALNSINDILSPSFIILFSILALFSLLPLIMQKKHKKQ